MNNVQSTDFDSLKKITDKLIAICKQYVEQFCSEDDASKLDKAYKESRLEEVLCILEKTQRCIEKSKCSEYQKAEEIVINKFRDNENVFDSSDNNKGSQGEKMEINSVIIAALLIIFAIVIIGVSLYIKDNRTRSKAHLSNHQKCNNLGRACKYSDSDKDLMELIHELSIIYDNTEKYLNS